MQRHTRDCRDERSDEDKQRCRISLSFFFSLLPTSSSKDTKKKKVDTANLTVANIMPGPGSDLNRTLWPGSTEVQAFQVQPEGQTHGEPNLGVQVQVRKKMPWTWPRPDLGQSMDVLKQKKTIYISYSFIKI